MASFLNLSVIALFSANDVEQTSAVIDDKKCWILRVALTLPKSCQLLSPFWVWNLLLKYQLLKYPPAAVFPLRLSLPCDRQKWLCERCKDT